MFGSARSQRCYALAPVAYSGIYQPGKTFRSSCENTRESLLLDAISTLNSAFFALVPTGIKSQRVRNRRDAGKKTQSCQNFTFWIVYKVLRSGGGDCLGLKSDCCSGTLEDRKKKKAKALWASLRSAGKFQNGQSGKLYGRSRVCMQDLCGVPTSQL